MAVNGPPIGLSVNITDANGATTRWGDEDTNPEDIPRGITFRTGRDGFGDASLTLSRRIDRDYVDINLLDEIQIVGADGSTAYEGRVGAAPRTFDTAHSISLQCAGWIAHTRDKQFREIYVDRDLSHWGNMSTARRVALLASVGTAFRSFDPTIQPDDAGNTSLRTHMEGPWGYADSEALYKMSGELRVAALYYDYVARNHTPTGASWGVNIEASDNDDMSGADTSGDIGAASAAGYFTPATPRQFIHLRHDYIIAFAGTDQYWIDWRKLAVYGNHGLTRRGTDPGGFFASDVIRDIIGRFCPKLNTTGVQDTAFAIPHLVFSELTYPYDALLEINKFHLWDFAVWENKTLYYAGVDLTDYDWEIRLDDHDYPAAVSLQGDSTQDLANGVTVQFQDVTTGQANILLPSDYTDLQDPDVENPFNKHGYDSWKAYQVTVPTTVEGALQLGRAALAEFNQPQAPGSITIGPHVRDRAGHPQPAWKVRAGDRVAITSSTSLSDRPRVISETSYDASSRQVTMSLDGGVKRLDAVVDRLNVALTAANLG
jgi:hypothetical protein